MKSKAAMRQIVRPRAANRFNRYARNSRGAGARVYTARGVLKLGVARRAWKRNYIANICHARYELHHPLEAEAEARMGHGAIASKVEVPPVILLVEMLRFHAGFEYVKAFFALAAADDFADAGNEHVHRAHRFAIVVDAHVKRFDGGGVVVNDKRFAEFFFGEIAFVLGLQVVAPLDWVLELFAGGSEDFDGFGIAESAERFVYDSFESFDDDFVDVFSEEFQILLAIGEDIAADALQEAFGERHVVVELEERGFGFDHPEFGEVPRRVRVLGAEGGTEGVDFAERGRVDFALELSGD